MFHTFDHQALRLVILPLEESSSTSRGRKVGQRAKPLEVGRTRQKRQGPWMGRWEQVGLGSLLPSAPTCRDSCQDSPT